MTTPKTGSAERQQLKFKEAVRRRFAFLHDLGFAEVAASTTIVRYESRSIGVNVVHGRQSYELEVQVLAGEDTFSLTDLIRGTDPDAARKYRKAAATTARGVANAVDRLADLTQLYGMKAIRGDASTLATIRRARTAAVDAYWSGMRAQQIRPAAAVAFKEGRFDEAIRLYEGLGAQLTAVEQKKLQIARQRRARG